METPVNIPPPPVPSRSGPAHDPESQCTGKRRYTMKSEAKQAIRRTETHTGGAGGRMQPYRCPHCGGWHIGHPRWKQRTPMPNQAAPIKPESRKRRSESAARAEVRIETLRRANFQCEAKMIVPEIECAGPLDVDEIVSRGVNPGGHLDPANTQALCRAHHTWRTEHPKEARERGLRKASYD